MQADLRVTSSYFTVPTMTIQGVLTWSTKTIMRSSLHYSSGARLARSAPVQAAYPACRQHSYQLHAPCASACPMAVPVSGAAHAPVRFFSVGWQRPDVRASCWGMSEPTRAPLPEGLSDDQTYWAEVAQDLDGDVTFNKLRENVDFRQPYGLPKEPTKLGIASWKDWQEAKVAWPQHAILMQFGDNIEAIGVDALATVAYTGANLSLPTDEADPSTLVPRVVIPLQSLPFTVKALNDEGLAVSYFREESAGIKKKRVHVFVSSMDMPVLPETLHGLTDESGIPIWMDDSRDTAPPPVAGVYETKNGYSLMVMRRETMTVFVSENLTDDVLVSKLLATGVAPPLRYHRESVKGLRGSDHLRNLVRRANVCSHTVSYRHADSQEGFVDKIKRDMFHDKDPASVHIKIVPEVGSGTRPRPPSVQTLGLLGLVDMAGSEPLLDTVIDKDRAPLLVRRWIRAQLLSPPPPHQALLIREALEHISTTAQGWDPTCVVPLKIRDVLDSPDGTSNLDFLQALAVQLIPPVLWLITGDNEWLPGGQDEVANYPPRERDPHSIKFTKALVQYIANEWRQGEPIDTKDWAAALKEAHAAILEVVEVVEEDLEVVEAEEGDTSGDVDDDDEDMDEEINRRELLMRSAERGETKLEYLMGIAGRVTRRTFARWAEAKEVSLRGISSTLLAKELEQMSQAKGQLLELVTTEVNHWSNLYYNVKGMKAESYRPQLIADADNGTFGIEILPTMKSLDAQRFGGMEQVFSHSTNASGEPISSKVTNVWITPKMKEQVQKYLKAHDAAEKKIKKHLKALNAKLKPLVMDLVLAAEFSVVAEALRYHSEMALTRGMCLPTLDPLLPVDASHAPRNTMKLTEVWPYFCSKADPETVRNDLKLDGMVLLTGANMGGKSTLLRSVCAAALLANCGLMVPAASAHVPWFDAFILRNFSGDSPQEGKSSFMMECENVRDVDETATSRSLVLLDELGKGTEVQSATVFCAAVLEELGARGCLGIFATHLHDLVDDLGGVQGIHFMRMALKPGGQDEGGLEPSWQVEDGVCKDSLAFSTALAEGVPLDVVQRMLHMYEQLKSKEHSV